MELLSWLHSRRRSLHQSDCVKAAHSLIETLNDVDRHPQLYLNKQVLQRTIHRYENIWIPLLTHVPRDGRTKLVPPLDIEWVWICHMLAPHIYAVDSVAIWNAHVPSEKDYVVDHAVLDLSERQNGLLRAESLWRKHFPNEPFNILAEIDAAPLVTDTDAPVPSGAAQASQPTSSLITYDIIAAAERQMAFHYQVAITPHYRHDGFLDTAAERYRMFLGLHKGSEGGRYVPTYDIDLMWHIHQLHPHLYALETTKIKGLLLPHDDTLNDRTGGAPLSQLWEATQKRWNEKYGGTICRAGGMFRGNVTAAERLLRSRLEADIADLVGVFPDEDVDGNWSICITPVEECAMKLPRNGGVEWVHMMYVRKALAGGSKASLRVSELSITGTEVHMEARLVNVAMRGVIAIHSAIEIFDARNAQRDDALPLASVHDAPVGSIVLHAPALSFRPYEEQGETLVLRIAGRDVALLAGRWDGYVKPVDGVAGVPGDKAAGRRGVPGKKGVMARPGVLRLAVTFLDETPSWTALVTRYKDDGRTPPVFEIGDPGKFRLRINLAEGSLQFRDKADAVLAALMGMGTALLHVRLQPRLQPGFKDGKESLYPKWGVQQQEHIALTAAGGEWNQGQRLVGYGQMLASTAVARGLPGSTNVWWDTQAMVSAAEYSSSCSKTFVNGMMFGCVEGYSWGG